MIRPNLCFFALKLERVESGKSFQMFTVTGSSDVLEDETIVAVVSSNKRELRPGTLSPWSAVRRKTDRTRDVRHLQRGRC